MIDTARFWRWTGDQWLEWAGWLLLGLIVGLVLAAGAEAVPSAP